MSLLSLDVETYSEIKLRDAGLHRYMDHPSFEVMLLAYSYDYEPATIIDLKAGEVLPPQLLHDLTDDKVIKCAWNAAFERNALERLTGLYMPPEQWRDTMILAASCGLPLSLDGASKALSLPEDKAKMAEGKKLIQYFCVPCKPTKKEPNRTRHLPEEAPERWEIFKTYCCRDVDAEMYIHQMLSDFEQDATEHRAWCQDQRINDLGVRLDMPLVQNAIRFDAINKAALVAEATALTGMENPTSVAQIKVWLQEQEGIEIESLNKKAMPDVLESLQSDVAKHFLVNLRSEFSKSSTAKYKAMERCVCSDNRARGLFQFGGARTFRWSGRRIQLQNLPQNHMTDLADAREIVRVGNYDNFTALYDNPSNVLSELIRTAIIPSEGNRFLVADFSSIEGVVLAWLAGEQWILDEYAGDKLIYEACAAQMFGVDKLSVKKGGENAHLRQKGKTATLACIAEGELVLTDKGLVPIESVTIAHKVWDGENWVTHDGVVYRGVKEVITYNGLTATRDHVVWTQGEQRTLEFGRAASCGAHLIQSGDGREAIRLSGDYLSGKTVEGRLGYGVCSDQMHGVRKYPVDASRESDQREVERLSELFAAEEDTAMVGKKADSSEEQMYKPKRARVQKLWSERYRVPIRLCNRGWRLGDATPWTPGQKFRIRSNRQQRTLRAWKFTLGNSPAAGKQYPLFEIENRVGPCGLALREGCCSSPVARRFVARRDYAVCDSSRKRKAEKLERNQGEVRTSRVYDILNAGPNHRFTVSNVLVHNCGYAGSVGALKAFGADKMGMSEEDMKDTVDRWRAANPNIVKLWYSLDRAAIKCVKTKMPAVDAISSTRFTYEGGILRMWLPGGRSVCYYNAEVGISRFGRPCVTYMGMDQYTKKWARVEMSGGRWAENLTQAVARDCLRDSMLNLEAEGFTTVMHCHDEVICEEPITGRSVEAMVEIMTRPISWAKGLHLRAEGFETLFYMKD